MLLVAIKHMIYETCIDIMFNAVVNNFIPSSDDFIQYIKNKVRIDVKNGEIAEALFIPVTGEYEYSYLLELYKQYYGHYPQIDPITYQDGLRQPFAHLILVLLEVFSDEYRKCIAGIVPHIE